MADDFRIPDLPDDVLHLICEQLGAQGEFASLYRCALSSSRLCDPALKTLYRLYDKTPLVTGLDDLELLSQRRPGNAPTTFGRQDAVRALMTKKWAQLWRSIIVSAMGISFRPYVLYIRALNLQNLENLFEDGKFRGSAEKMFFAGEMAKFNYRKDYPYKIPNGDKVVKFLDIATTVNEIGGAIVEKAYLLEELGAHKVGEDQLPKWLSTIPRLEALRLWFGDALDKGAGKVIRQHCPNFRALTIFGWDQSWTTDTGFTDFLRELAPNSLQHLETINRVEFSIGSFEALATYHASSLNVLKLAAMVDTTVMALYKLAPCTELRVLSLEDYLGAMRLEERQNDLFLVMIDWIVSCRNLTSLDFKKVYDAPAILASVLDPSSEKPLLPLTHLGVEAYNMLGPSAENFHSSLPVLAQTLTSLSLKAEGDDAMPVDLDLLVNSITRLWKLQHLYLKDISDNFTNGHITKLAVSLPHLVEFWTSGNEITDEVFAGLATLRNLKVLHMYAMAQFTFQGIYDYIMSLTAEPTTDGDDATNFYDNRGLWLSIWNAEVGWGLSEDEQAKLRELIETKLGGRFDFTLSRDPDDDSEFEGDSD